MCVRTHTHIPFARDCFVMCFHNINTFPNSVALIVMINFSLNVLLNSICYSFTKTLCIYWDWFKVFKIFLHFIWFIFVSESYWLYKINWWLPLFPYAAEEFIDHEDYQLFKYWNGQPIKLLIKSSNSFLQNFKNWL